MYVLPGEGFVDLESVNVVDSEAGFLQEPFDRRDRPPSHRRRLNTCGNEGEDEVKEKTRRRRGGDVCCSVWWCWRQMSIADTHRY